MIATILYSSPTFEAVDYNERKVSMGDASLIVRENFGYLDLMKDYQAAHLREYLVDYSKQNDRIKKPQLHVAFSCRGQEMDEQQLVSFARQWLGEMGYNDPKQPLLIYRHNDTDNNHIHVITSRINPEGKKIDHSHERVRSKAFVDKTLGVDTKGDLDKTVAASLTYKFETLSQWKAVLEASGYDVAQEGKTLKIEKNGAYQSTIALDEVEGRLSSGYADKKRLQQIKAQLLKYRDTCVDKKELQEVMKKKFGISVVYFGGKDNPRGYFVVDNKNRQVFKGSSVLKIDRLLAFESREDKMKRIDAFLDAKFEEKEHLTSRELNRLLKNHYSASYRDGVIYFKGEEKKLLPYMYQALKHNDRLEYARGFDYATREEKEALCKHFNIGADEIPDKKGKENRDIEYILDRSKKITDWTNDIKKIRDAFKDEGLALVHDKGKFFVVDTHTKSICCLNDYGIRIMPEQGVYNDGRQTMPKLRGGGYVRGSGAANREDEVGGRGKYDDTEENRGLKL